MTVPPDYASQLGDQGYLLLRRLIDPEYFAGIMCRVEQAVDRRARKLRDEGAITDIHEDEPILYRWQRIYADMGNYQARRSWDEDIISSELHDLMRHPSLLDVLEQLIGPEILATGMFALRPKVPHDKRTEVLWH